MYCKECGREIDNDSKFCIFCGHNIYEEKKIEAEIKAQVKAKLNEYLYSSEPMTEKDKKVVRVFIAFIILAIIITTLVAMTMSYNRGQLQKEKSLNR